MESKLHFQPSEKFSDHEQVGNISSVALLGSVIDSHFNIVDSTC